MVDWNNILEILKNIIVPALVTLGILAAYWKFFYEKKIKAYQIKLSKYLEIATPIARIYGGSAEPGEQKKFCQKMNELYFFASGDVIKELLNLDKKLRSGDKLYTQDFKNLIIAIRKDLGLGSRNLKEEKDFCMFQTMVKVPKK